MLVHCLYMLCFYAGLIMVHRNLCSRLFLWDFEMILPQIQFSDHMVKCSCTAELSESLLSILKVWVLPFDCMQLQL